MISRTEQDALILAHRKAAKKYAWRLAQASGAVHRMSEVESEALVGLCEAAKRFDPSRGVRFLTFAAFWIRACVTRYIDETRHIVRPSHEGVQRSIAVKVSPAERRLAQILGREPTVAEVAAELGVEERYVTKARNRFRKFDVSVSDTERHLDHWVPVDEAPTPYDAAEQESDHRERMRAINRAMHNLSSREREVIRRRWLTDEPETLRGIGETWGLSYERVRQIERDAIMKMKRALKDGWSRWKAVA